MKRFILLLALFLSGTAMAQFKHPGLDQWQHIIPTKNQQ
jgi:hypothetical protein